MKKQRHYFANKGPSSQSYGFSSSHVWMWQLDYKESWAPKNWCFRTVVLERTLEGPLNYKEIKPVNPKGNQSWKSTGRTDAEAETPILWPPDSKVWLTGKDPDAGKRLKAEGDKRGWDGWMAAPTRWTWVWASSGGWWWTRNPGMLQSMGLQKVGQDWATELNWIQEMSQCCFSYCLSFNWGFKTEKKKKIGVMCTHKSKKSLWTTKCHSAPTRKSSLKKWQYQMRVKI